MCGSCGGSRLAADGSDCRLCGHERDELERVGRSGVPGADYAALEREVARLRGALAWIAEYGSRNGDLRGEDMWLGAVRAIAKNALLVGAAPCGPVESAAAAVAPWCADHVRESEELRSPGGPDA